MDEDSPVSHLFSVSHPERDVIERDEAADVRLKEE